MAASEPLTLEARQEILAEEVTRASWGGWRVQSQSATQATLVKGKHTSHLLHLVLTIFTLGLWAIVWIIVALTGGEKSKVITVDARGQVLHSG